ncbi:MAG TPA: methylated-DNA--[protein]-cysteine S-methyltransferase [Acidimicrobiia bacterium]|nr:methylated-DNA--[protein]-cysteine S-methyltransferase [Acidimicrobiia bacterium]
MIDTDERVTRVERACRAIEADGTSDLQLAELAALSGTSPDTLRRDFLRVLGVTPKQYADGLRVERLRAELRDGRPVTDAMYDVGYGSSSRLYEQSNARLGMTPSSYGARGKGASIAFTIADSPFDRLLVAATERGVCSVRVGSDDVGLETHLRDEFSAASVARDDDLLKAAVDEVLRRVDGDTPLREVPLDMRGTAFQLKVWRELLRIPRGETRTYGEVAEAVGSPGGARAVGQACGNNPVAFVVPCHRVIAADGGLGGYAFGLDVKRRVLDGETRPA